MGEPRTASEFVAALAAENRVMMLGGMAVIAHGRSRTTKDSDIWLDPAGGPKRWIGCLEKVRVRYSSACFFSISQQRKMGVEEALEEGVGFGMVRILGLSMPLDVFYKASECELEDFETFWKNGSLLEDGTKLPDPIDLYITKMNTGRDRDGEDLNFLETLIKRRFSERLPQCGIVEARKLFERYTDPELLDQALENPDIEVREYALEQLRSFEAEGDPFSRDILADWNTKRKR